MDFFISFEVSAYVQLAISKYFVGLTFFLVSFFLGSRVFIFRFLGGMLTTVGLFY